MSEPQFVSFPAPGAAPSPGGDVRAAIARAAQATGVDFDYLLAQAKIESSLDPAARAKTSSAAGLYQFTRGTWLETLDRHGSTHGLDWADAAIEGGRVRDPAMRAQIMALRHDPGASALMAAELARDNGADLEAVLGRKADAAELYLAHFLGSGGARQFLAALAANPSQGAAALLPQAAAANRSIFFEPSGAPRSVAGVMDHLRGKVARAMEGAPAEWPMTMAAQAGPSLAAPPAAPLPPSAGPIARQFHAAASGSALAPVQQPTGPRASMADTLAAAFGLTGAGGDAGPPDHVRAAYASLRSLGL